MSLNAWPQLPSLVDKLKSVSNTGGSRGVFGLLFLTKNLSFKETLMSYDRHQWDRKNLDASDPMMNSWGCLIGFVVILMVVIAVMFLRGG